jgi:hypothetical protein
METTTSVRACAVLAAPHAATASSAAQVNLRVKRVDSMGWLLGLCCLDGAAGSLNLR